MKLSYNIVCYYVFSYFKYYGGPLTAINAVLAIFVVIYTEGEEINYFLLYFIDSDKTLRRRPRPTPCKEAPWGGVCSSIKTMALEEEMAPSWWGCL